MEETPSKFRVYLIITDATTAPHVTFPEETTSVVGGVEFIPSENYHLIPEKIANTLKREDLKGVVE